MGAGNGRRHGAARAGRRGATERGRHACRFPAPRCSRRDRATRPRCRGYCPGRGAPPVAPERDAQARWSGTHPGARVEPCARQAGDAVGRMSGDPCSFVARRQPDLRSCASSLTDSHAPGRSSVRAASYGVRVLGSCPSTGAATAGRRVAVDAGTIEAGEPRPGAAGLPDALRLGCGQPACRSDDRREWRQASSSASTKPGVTLPVFIGRMVPDRLAKITRLLAKGFRLARREGWQAHGRMLSAIQGQPLQYRSANAERSCGG